jgi:hypothetical protein
MEKEWTTIDCRRVSARIVNIIITGEVNVIDAAILNAAGQHAGIIVEKGL